MPETRTGTTGGAGAGQAFETVQENQPYVGRQVLFGFRNIGSTSGIEMRAATITRLNDDQSCQLNVLNPDGSGSQPMRGTYSATNALGCWTPHATTVQTGR